MYRTPFSLFFYRPKILSHSAPHTANVISSDVVDGGRALQLLKPSYLSVDTMPAINNVMPWAETLGNFLEPQSRASRFYPPDTMYRTRTLIYLTSNRVLYCAALAMGGGAGGLRTVYFNSQKRGACFFFFTFPSCARRWKHLSLLKSTSEL